MAAVEQVGARDTAAARTSVLGRGWPLRLAGYAAMILAVAIIGVPLVWMISAAFKETSEIYLIPATWIPNEPTLANFPRAWRAAPFGQYYVNTTIVTAVSVFGKLVLGSLSAYALVMLSFQIGRASCRERV